MEVNYGEVEITGSGDFCLGGDMGDLSLSCEEI